MTIQDLWLFILSGFLLNITPGPDIALVVAQSARNGTRAGIAAALGIGAGSLVHIAAGAIGLSAVLMTSAWAFTVVKWLGAVYLVFIGGQMLVASFRGGAPVATSGVEFSPQSVTGSHTMLRIFFQGALTNVLNPKVAMFFLAFLPQFIRPGADSAALSFVVLGLIFNVIGTAWNIGVAIAAGRAAATAGAGQIVRWLEGVIGGVFVALGIKLALSQRT